MRLPWRRALARVAVVATAIAWSTYAYAGDPAAAREQLKLGYELSQAGKCAEAVPHLEESLRLDAKAITLINLANCEEKTARLADAMGHWVEARARAEAEGATKIQEEAERRATALEPRLPKLTIVLAQAAAPAKDVTVTRDTTALGSASLGVALPVNPGEHVIVVHAPGHEDATTKVTIEEAEQKSVDVTLGPVATGDHGGGAKPASGRTSSLVYAGFGGAIVFAGVGAITGLMALSKANDAERDCPALRCRDQAALDSVESGRALGTISTIAFIAVPVFAAIGVSGLFLGGKKKDAPVVAISFGSIGGRF